MGGASLFFNRSFGYVKSGSALSMNDLLANTRSLNLKKGICAIVEF